MNPLGILGRVKLLMLGRVLVLGFWYPLFVFPTLRATKKCMEISTEKYGKEHHKNGRANAFRHALWNYLIALECLKWSKNQAKVLLWAKKITDWHEAAFHNRELAKRMDLHNNSVGRIVFTKSSNQSEEDILKNLTEMAANSIHITEESDLKNLESTLVHIIDEG